MISSSRFNPSELKVFIKIVYIRPILHNPNTESYNTQLEKDMYKYLVLSTELIM